MNSQGTMHFLKRRLLLRICALLLCMLTSASGDSRRPIYNIAHMVNSIQEFEDFLARGANAVEMDIQFHKNGSVRNVYHGYPCDCYRICDERENFDNFLHHIRETANPKSRNFRKQLILIQLDLKLDEVPRNKKYAAGEEIAKHLISHLWNKDKSEPRISVLVTVGHTHDADVIRGIRETFQKSNRGSFLNKLGFDVGMNDDLDSIRRMWSKLNVKSNRWQGDGITNCLRPLRDDARLREAIRYRNSSLGFVDKVYDWTVDLTTNMRNSLRLGVDGILTNFPERVHAVLQEREFLDTYRLASVGDDPFSRVSVILPSPKHKFQNLDTYVGSMREMTVALIGYFYDFYRLRLQRPSSLIPLIPGVLHKSRSSNQAKDRYSSGLVRLTRRNLMG